MESQIFTVLTKRFKSGRLSFSKLGATCLAKICAIKVEQGIIEIEKIEQEVPVDNSMEEYMKEIKEGIKKVQKALIIKKADRISENKEKQEKIHIDSKDPIFQALRLTKISELDYII